MMCHKKYRSSRLPRYFSYPFLMPNSLRRTLLSDAVAVPLFAQQKRLLIAPDIRNLIFAPFGPVLDLTYTTKE